VLEDLPPSFKRAGSGNFSLPATPHSQEPEGEFLNYREIL